jgi:hypothetical protein
LEVQIVKDNALTIAYAALFTGIALLAITFISAIIFLVSNPPITSSSDIIDTFGDSLAPLIEASIRIMFLGVMGWIGSILTARGVQLVTQIKRLAKNEDSQVQSVQSLTAEFDKLVEPTKPKATRKKATGKNSKS